MNDLIDRQAAIDALWKALYEYEDKTEKQFQESDELDIGDWILHREFVQNMSDIDRRTILDLPSAQPERKTGRWINISDGCFEIVKCDQCGKTKDDPSNYCPNCGAKMEGAEE